MKPRVVVVGGGISGLTISYELLQRAERGPPGIEIVCLEASGRAGGNIRTEHGHGFICESGPTGFLDNSPATLTLVDAHVHIRVCFGLAKTLDAAHENFASAAHRLAKDVDHMGLLMLAETDATERYHKLRACGDRSAHDGWTFSPASEPCTTRP